MQTTRKLYRARVRVNGAPKSYLIWTQNPEDNEGLKHIFQEQYGFWPIKICVDDIVDQVPPLPLDQSQPINLVDEPLTAIPTKKELDLFRRFKYGYICRSDGTMVANPYPRMVANNEPDHRQPNFD